MLTKNSILLALAAAATAAPAPSSPQLSARNNDGGASKKTNSVPESHWEDARLTANGFTSDKWIKGFEKAQAVVAGLTFEQKVRRSLLSSSASRSSSTAS